MNTNESIIYEEVMSAHGFLSKTTHGAVSREQFTRLNRAVHEYAKDVSRGVTSQCFRLVAACLFDLVWELDGTIHHLKSSDPSEGEVLERMLETLRISINELLWVDLDEYYTTVN